jgi:enoyl-CoA hydratase
VSNTQGRTPAIDDFVGGTDDVVVSASLGDVRLIVFNRPRVRNALTRDMRRTFATLLAQADADPDVRVIIVAGAGGAFCAGVDLKESRANPGMPLVRPHPGEALRSLHKLAIAAVDGPCVTGGLEIALSCTFIIASDRSSFADTHARVGMFPAWGLSALLPEAIGNRRALQMSVTGAFINAQTAYEWGLVNEVVPAETLLARVLELGQAEVDVRSIRYQLDLQQRTCGQPRVDTLDAEAKAWERWRANERDP